VKQVKFIERRIECPTEYVQAMRDYNGVGDYLTFQTGSAIEKLYPIIEWEFWIFGWEN
jgi:hypothetical protein